MAAFAQALRRLSREPGFALGAIVLLAIGLGANLTMFSGINGGLYKSQPGVADPDNLLEVGIREGLGPLSLPEFRAVRGLDAVAGAAAVSPSEYGVAHGASSRLFGGALVTANYFDLVGVKPHLGRFFREEEDAPGHCNVVVMSHGLWSRFLNADPAMVGGPIRINGYPFELIGVARPEFTGTRRMDPDWLWMPLHARTTFLPGSRLPEDPRTNWLSVLARPKPGAAYQQLRSQLDGLYAEFGKYGGNAGMISALRYHPIGAAAAASNAAWIARMLLFGAWLVLAVVWANVANLFLARALDRRRETAIRLAMGATRWTLVKESFAEGLLLAGAGTVLAFLIDSWLRDSLAGLVPRSPDGDPAVIDLSADWRVIGYAALAALISAAIFAIFPAIQSSRLDLNSVLKSGGLGGAARSSRLREILVVVQVALAVLLLAGGGMFAEAANNLRKTDLGFDVDGILLAQVNPGLNGYDRERQARYYETLVERVRALPGVKSAAAASLGPVSGSSDSIGRIFGGALPVEGRIPSANIVSDGYFAALGLPLLEGRGIEDSDRAGHRRVVVVNQTLAELVWPGESAIGKLLRIGSRKSSAEWHVVGVTRDARVGWLNWRKSPHLYVPLQQLPSARATIHARSAGGDPMMLAPAIRAIAAEIDPFVPLTRVQTARVQADSTIWTSIVLSIISACFAGVTLFLAAAGLYASLSRQVASRTREIGVRMALGAPAGRILLVTAGSNLKLATIGFAAGCGIAWAATGGISAAVFRLAAGCLAAAAIAASYLPAKRAAGVDPVNALRQE